MITASIVSIAMTATWYGAKVFLRARGIRVGWLTRHYQDFASLRELAHRSPDVADRRRARTFLWGLRFWLGLFVLLAVALFLSGTKAGPR